MYGFRSDFQLSLQVHYRMSMLARLSPSFGQDSWEEELESVGSTFASSLFADCSQIQLLSSPWASYLCSRLSAVWVSRGTVSRRVGITTRCLVLCPSFPELSSWDSAYMDSDSCTAWFPQAQYREVKNCPRGPGMVIHTIISVLGRLRRDSRSP